MTTIFDREYAVRGPKSRFVVVVVVLNLVLVLVLIYLKYSLVRLSVANTGTLFRQAKRSAVF